jgi:hypothetical protein
MKHAQAEPVRLPRTGTQAPQGLELRHLRYFVAVADAGTFTHAAERKPAFSTELRARADSSAAAALYRHGQGLKSGRRGPGPLPPA